jgi:hypothetical protein
MKCNVRPTDKIEGVLKMVSLQWCFDRVKWPNEAPSQYGPAARRF